MCGRFVMPKASSDLVAAFGVEEQPGPELPPSWNVAPTQPVNIVTERLDQGTGELSRRLEVMRWGLVPSWAKDPKVGSRMINARSETILEKPSFRSAAVKRRGLVPAAGYYEWMKTDTGKVPTYLTSETGGLLAFAALYEFWPDPALPEDHEHKWLASCTILTTMATDALGHIHERSPVLIPEDWQAEWLNAKTTDRTAVRQLLDALPEPRLVPYEVSDRVNSVRNNGPELIEPVPTS
jgi:putative SOS response-associated peptidase YedK